MKQIPTVSFEQFLQAFPEIPLPVTLSEATHHEFSNLNQPLSQGLIEAFILSVEPEPADDLTEFVPCFRVPATFDFHALVYWRAGLMDYQYVLLTFDKKGHPIDRRVIGGTYSDGDLLTQSIVTIEEDWEIVVVTGQGKTDLSDNYRAANTRLHKLELLPEGKIVNL